LAEGQLSASVEQEHTLKLEKARAEIERLSKKRGRVLDSYFEGILTREERDQKLHEVDRDLALYQQWLSEEAPLQSVSPGSPVGSFRCFFGMEATGSRRQEKAVVLSSS